MENTFCFVAEKDGRWAGVVVANNEHLVRDFYRDFAGFEIKPFATRDDWDAYRKATPSVFDEEPA